jgi:hypothetical protein
VPGTVAGAFASKVMVGTKKTTMPAQKRRVPAIGVMVVASWTESHESSPHVLAAGDSLLDNGA